MPEVIHIRQLVAPGFEKLRGGRPSDIDVIRLLELYEWFHETRQDYWAAMAAAIANQAIRPDR